MSVLSSVLLVPSDPRTEAGLRFGFTRVGVKTHARRSNQSIADALVDECQLVVTGAKTRDSGLALLGEIRGALDARKKRIPVLYLGNGVTRKEAIDGGASELMPQPSYVKDVVTMSRILCSPVKESTSSISGELRDHYGLFYIVRALSAVKRRGVLTMVRGLRRGELRFYDGEVTSAQAGPLHGLAAFHQLLLWAEARFDLRAENVVRRQQIPMSPEELFEDAEKFMHDLLEIADGLSPAAVYGPTPSAQNVADAAPDEVRAVLRLFDGNRSLADIIEDSPFRLFETLRMAGGLRSSGAIEETAASKTKLGGDARDSGATKTATSGEVDWSALVPDRRGIPDRDTFSQLVPAASAAGEIVLGEGTSAGASAAAADEPSDLIPDLSGQWQGEDEAGGSGERGAHSQRAPSEPMEESKVASGEISIPPPPKHLGEPVATPTSPIVLDVPAINAQPEPVETAAVAPKSSTAEAQRATEPEPESENRPTESARKPSEPAKPAAAAKPIAAKQALRTRTPTPKPDKAAKQQRPRTPTPKPERGKRKSTNPPIDEKDAFTDAEAAFFAAGTKLAEPGPSAAESFDDLDDGFEVPKSFWQRLLARPDQGPKKKSKTKRR